MFFPAWKTCPFLDATAEDLAPLSEERTMHFLIQARKPLELVFTCERSTVEEK